MSQAFYKTTFFLRCVYLTVVLISCGQAIQEIQRSTHGNNETSDSSPGHLKDLAGDSLSRNRTAGSSEASSTDWIDESSNSPSRASTVELPRSSSEVTPTARLSPRLRSTSSTHSFFEQPYTWRNLLQEKGQDWRKNYPLYRQFHYISSYKRNIEDRASKLLLVGGLGESGSDLNDTWIYTPWSNSWLEVTAASQLPSIHTKGHSVLPTLCDTFVPLINSIGDIWLFDGRTEIWSRVRVGATNRDDYRDDFSVEGTVAFRHSSCPSNCSCFESVFIYGRLQPLTGILRLCELKCLTSQGDQMNCHFEQHRYECININAKLSHQSNWGELIFAKGIMSAPDHDRGIIYFLSRRLPTTFGTRTHTTLFKYDVQHRTFQSYVINHNLFSFDNILVWNNSLLLLFDLSAVLAVSLKNNSKHGVLNFDLKDDSANPSDVVLGMQSATPFSFRWVQVLPPQPHIYVYRAVSNSSGSFPSFVESMKAFPPQLSPGSLRYHTSVYDYDLHTFYMYGGLRYDRGQELMNTSDGNLWTLTMPSNTWWLIKPHTTPSSYVSNCGTYSSLKVILFGGQYDDGRVGNELWIYNTKRRIWKQSVPIKDSWPEPRARCSLTAFPKGTTSVLYGGYTAAGRAMSDVWLLHHGDDEWQTIMTSLEASTKRMPFPRFGHSTTVVGDELVIYGGQSNSLEGRGYVYLSDMWAFSITSRTWREIPISPRRSVLKHWRFNSTAVDSYSISFLLPYGTSKIVVLESFPGESSKVSNSVWIIDTVSKKITDLPPLNISFAPQAAGIWNGSFVYYGHYIYSEQERMQEGVLMAIGQSCVSGSAQLRGPTGPCVPCPIGQYSISHLTVRECTKCPQGTITKTSGSISIKNCTCNLNYCVHGTCRIAGAEDDGIRAVCTCSFGFAGQQCDQISFVLFILTLGILAVVVIVTTVLTCCGIRIVRHRRARRKTEWELQETRKSFTIMPREIELICRLDEDCPGGYGRVHKAMYRDWIVAVKQLQVVMAEWVDIRTEFLREIQFMRTVRHPNIVMFVGAGQYDDNHPFLVLEFLIGGALRSLLLNSDIELTGKDKLQFMLDTAEGMKYLHTLQPPRIHRDLKSANLLLSSRRQVKVADFGTARLIPQLSQKPSWQRPTDTSNNRGEGRSYELLDEGCQLTSRHIGTPRWRSPEIWRKKSYGTATDVYSFAVVVWEILTRRTPFSGPAFRFDAKVEDAVLNGTRPTIPHDSPQDLSSLIQQCWKENSKDRPSFSDIAPQLQSMVNTLPQPDVSADVVPCHNLPTEAATQFSGLANIDARGSYGFQAGQHEMVTLHTSST